MNKLASTGLLAIVALAIAGSTTAQASNSIAQVSDLVAKAVHKYAEQEKNLKAPIFVEKISLPSSFRSPGGESIRMALKTALRGKRLTVVGKPHLAEWIISGTCMSRPQKGDLTLVINIKDQNNIPLSVIPQLIKEIEHRDLQPDDAEVKALRLDQTGNKAAVKLDDLVEVNRIKGFTGDLATYVAKNADLQVEGTKLVGTVNFKTLAPAGQDTASEKAKQALKKITDTVIPGLKYHERPRDGGTAIAASEHSLFQVMLIVFRDGSSHTAKIAPDSEDSRFLFTQLQKDDRYLIKIRNRSKHDAGVMITVDGVNTLHFADDTRIKERGKWYVPAEEEIQISGWFRNFEKSDDFLVVPEPQSVVAQEGLSTVSEVGMISAEFYYATTKENQRAQFDMLMAHITRSPGQLLGTGLGQQRDITTRKVPNVIFGTNPLALITIRYDRPDLPPTDLPNDLPGGPPPQ